VLPDAGFGIRAYFGAGLALLVEVENGVTGLVVRAGISIGLGDVVRVVPAVACRANSRPT
jgi:hypothetical protein